MTGGSPILRRVIAEHRRVLTTLAVLILANIAVYAFIVYPLGQRVANSQQRDEAAEQGLAAARAEGCASPAYATAGGAGLFDAGGRRPPLCCPHSGG